MDSKNYVALIPTFDVSYACYLRAAQAAAAQLAVHASLPALYGGLADNANGQAAPGGAVTIGGLTSRTPPAPAIAAAPITYLLADQTSRVPLCRNGHCVAGQAQFNPALFSEVTLNGTVVFPSAACSDERVRRVPSSARCIGRSSDAHVTLRAPQYCVRCDALGSVELRYASAQRTTLTGGLSNVIAVVSESSLACVERGRAAMDMVALGARGVVIVLPPAFVNSTAGTNGVLSVALAGLQAPLAAPTWTVSASNGAAMLRAPGLRLRMPGGVGGLARAPGTWADEGIAVNLDLPGGLVLADDSAAEEEERKRVIGGAVGGLLLGGSALAAMCAAALYFYRRRQRRYAAFNEAGGLWEPREQRPSEAWSAPPPQQFGAPRQSAGQMWSTTVAPPDTAQQNPMWSGSGVAGEPQPSWALQPPPEQPVLGVPVPAPPPDWVAPTRPLQRQESPTRAAALMSAAGTFDVEQSGVPRRSSSRRQPTDFYDSARN